MAGTSSWGVRVGGALGVVAAVTAIPAYLVGSPEQPTSADDLPGYFDSTDAFLSLNAVLPLVHLVTALLFLAVLVSILRRAAGPRPASYLALIGGAFFVTLTAAGLAAEVAVPAAIAQFGDVTVASFSQPFLALAIWLYHYSQLGAALLIFATAFIVWRTGVLPKFTAVLAVLGILPLLHTWVGVPGAYSTIAWFGLTGLVLLIAPPREVDAAAPTDADVAPA